MATKINKDIADAMNAFLDLGENNKDQKAMAKLYEICERNHITMGQLGRTVLKAVQASQ